jgi:predicted RNase H-like HicB family nuclease
MAKIKTTEYSYTVIYEPIRERGYQVTVPLLPGLVTYGRDLEEARGMARDAILCYLEALRKDKEKIPSETSLIQEKITVPLAR